MKRYVEIDVAKAQLDVFIRPTDERLSVANDEVGVRRLVEQLGPSDFVILEATGGLEVPVAGALAIGGITGSLRLSRRRFRSAKILLDEKEM